MLVKCAPFTADYPVPEGKASGYLCENGACRQSETDFTELIS